MVLSSHDQLGDTDRKTGFWLEEFAAPYYVFKDAGVDITLSSPRGGQPPVDPRSEEPDVRTAATRRFRQDEHAQAALACSIKLGDAVHDDYDAVFYPGGHGPLWDLSKDPVSIALIEVMGLTGKFVVAVCHGPAAFRYAKNPGGAPLVSGKSVTGFSNSEEAAIGLTLIVPFLIEDMLRDNGAFYSKAGNWQPHIAVDGKLITGQNPASSEPAARALLHHLAMQQYSQMPRGGEPMPPFPPAP
jgi:putative intracellular protease/amidase